MDDNSLDHQFKIRELEYPGKALLVLAGLALLVSFMNLASGPSSERQVKMLERHIGGSVDQDTMALFREQADKMIEKEKKAYKISLYGTLIILVGFILTLFRGMWGPRIILIGCLFKIWLGVQSDIPTAAFYLIILSLALIMTFKWNK